MPTEITMPQLSDTMTEGTIVKWLKKEGDSVRAGEIVAEVETDKATMEMESFESGTITKLLIPEGNKAPVGAAIAVVAKSGEKADSAIARKSTTPTSTPALASTAAPNPAQKPAAPQRVEAASAPVHAVESRIKISPLAKRIAQDLGIDPATIQGSGPNGRIVQSDVLNAPKGATAPTSVSTRSAPAAPMAQRIASGQSEKIPLTKMRQTIATRLQQAKQVIPHIYVSIDVDMEAINSLREKLNQQLEAEKIRVSVADFIQKACATALKKHPGVNAHFDEKNNQIIRYGDVHIGNAVALPDGLIVPVLRSVDQMSWKEIRVRSADLFDRAKKQKLKREEMNGATFTITNLGMWGVKDFQAIVNPPEVAILAVAASEPRPVVRNGQIVVRSTMTLTLSADHRAVDGALTADFLKTLKTLLEEPALMLV